MRVLAGRCDVDDVDAFVAWLGDVGDEAGCAVQAFDARYVAGTAHLETAVARANRAFERGENVARDRSVEILLYAAGRRQIDQAIEMGVPTGEDVPMVVVIDADAGAGVDAELAIGGDAGPDADADAADAADAEDAAASKAEDAAVTRLTGRLDVDPSVLERGGDTSRIRAFFDVTEAEVGAAATDLEGLVRERVALLDVEK